MSSSQHLNEINKLSESIKLKINDMFSWFDCVPTLILIGDNSNLFKINNRWADVLGYDIKDILNWEWMSYIHPHDIIPTIECFKNEENNYFSIYNRYRKANDDYIWISWEGSKVKDMYYASGRVIRDNDPIIDILKEISDKREKKYNSLKIEEG